MKSQSWFRVVVLLACGFISMLAASGTQPGGGQRQQDRVTREVYHELVMLPQLTIFDNISFKVNGGKVTLLGQVRNAVLKDEAQGAIKKVEGVESVDNQIEILPPSSEDDRIRLQVARALFNDDGLFRYSMGSVPSIHIIVRMGHVTLEGAVNNQTDKDRAGLKANGVPGIFEVKNNLQIQQGSMHVKTLHNG
jgi:hyperosmotically inducible periplasmic protein